MPINALGEIGLEQFTIDIEQVDGGTLVERFTSLVSERDDVKRKMARYVDQCRARLADLERQLRHGIATIAEGTESIQDEIADAFRPETKERGEAA